VLKIIRNEIIRLQTIITSVNTELTTITNEFNVGMVYFII
jgi:hypothetical protein